eukprot:585176-Hanusia_phi.AAC.3
MDSSGFHRSSDRSCGCGRVKGRMGGGRIRGIGWVEGEGAAGKAGPVVRVRYITHTDEDKLVVSSDEGSASVIPHSAPDARVDPDRSFTRQKKASKLRTCLESAPEEMRDETTSTEYTRYARNACHILRKEPAQEDEARTRDLVRSAGGVRVGVVEEKLHQTLYLLVGHKAAITRVDSAVEAAGEDEQGGHVDEREGGTYAEMWFPVPVTISLLYSPDKLTSRVRHLEEEALGREQPNPVCNHRLKACPPSQLTLRFCCNSAILADTCHDFFRHCLPLLPHGFFSTSNISTTLAPPLLLPPGPGPHFSFSSSPTSLASLLAGAASEGVVAGTVGMLVSTDLMAPERAEAGNCDEVVGETGRSPGAGGGVGGSGGGVGSPGIVGGPKSCAAASCPPRQPPESLPYLRLEEQRRNPAFCAHVGQTSGAGVKIGRGRSEEEEEEEERRGAEKETQGVE